MAADAEFLSEPAFDNFPTESMLLSLRLRFYRTVDVAPEAVAKTISGTAATATRTADLCQNKLLNNLSQYTSN